MAAWVMLLLCLPAAALAAPEEIEVYQDELGAKGELGLETNMSYVFSGRAGEDDGHVQESLHRFRMTPEIAYGLGHGLEFGVLAAATLDRRGAAGVHGAAVRLRYLAPHEEGRWYWGGNLEVGGVDGRMDDNPWGAEFRAIAGVQKGRWIIAINPTLEWTLSGPRPEPLSFELQSKLGYRLREGLAIGIESYNGFGRVSRPAPGREEQVLYTTADAAIGPVEVNLGLGRGLNGHSDGWVVKTVIGAPLR